MSRHATGCQLNSHEEKKWCWLPEEVTTLQEQAKTTKSWDEISELFVVDGVKRHGSLQCATKHFHLLLERAGLSD